MEEYAEIMRENAGKCGNYAEIIRGKISLASNLEIMNN